MVLNMPRKTKDNIVFKELGSLQEKILFFLAENPENHKQGIQQGINHPADQYGSVSKAVDSLETHGFVVPKDAVSQKNVRIKTYSCTESAIFYALTRNPSANPVKIFEAYKNKVSWCESLRQLYDIWGRDHFMAYFRDVGDVLPIIQKKGFSEALPYLFFKAVELTHSIDKRARNRNVREALKLFPENKEMLKEWRKNIDEVLSGSS
jgi:DNA-binding PadR family transcriptional regulator